MDKKSSTITLSKRLRSLADMVPYESVVADVGCDHGFLSIYLVESGICKKALAMDVRKGPLGAAKEHILERGLVNYIETRLSDGLSNMEAAEADTLVVAGMGGRLMTRILQQYPEKTDSFRVLILQPQSELMEFRRSLRLMGYTIVEEQIVSEEGKYYFPMKAVKASPDAYKLIGENGKELADGTKDEGWKDKDAKQDVWRLYDKFGKGLIEQKSLLFMEYLRWQQGLLEELRTKLSGEAGERSHSRYLQIEGELRDIEEVLKMMQKV